MFIQEKLYEEQLHQHELILQEAQRTSHDHAKAVSKLEALDETCRNTQITSDVMKVELAKAKVPCCIELRCTKSTVLFIISVD